MTSLSKIVYIDELNDMVNKCNSAYYSTIKLKHADVNSSTYVIIYLSGKEIVGTFYEKEL